MSSASMRPLEVSNQWEVYDHTGTLGVFSTADDAEAYLDSIPLEEVEDRMHEAREEMEDRVDEAQEEARNAVLDEITAALGLPLAVSVDDLVSMIDDKLQEAAR